MKRQSWHGWMAAGIVTIAATGILYAQEGQPPRPPEGREGREGGGPMRRDGVFRPMMMPSQLFASGDYVFVLRGNTLYKYDVKELKLQGKVELEAPTPPRPPQQ